MFRSPTAPVAISPFISTIPTPGRGLFSQADRLYVVLLEGTRHSGTIFNDMERRYGAAAFHRLKHIENGPEILGSSSILHPAAIYLLISIYRSPRTEGPQCRRSELYEHACM